MKKEEKILIDKFGKANHFSVPEGYFEFFHRCFELILLVFRLQLRVLHIQK